MTDMGTYILKDKIAYPCPDLEQWTNWMGENPSDRIVAKTRIGELMISTVFLGFDHNFLGGEPMLFETMIFDEGDEGDSTPFEGSEHGFFEHMKRDSSWADATVTHRKACESVKARLAHAREQSENFMHSLITNAKQDR